jgi:mycothiol synthase
MEITARPYETEDDWVRITALLAAAWKPEGLDTVETVGGYSWWRRSPDWADALGLWEDRRGQLAGVTSLEPGHLEIHVHPEYQESGLDQQMLSWAEGQCRRRAARNGEAAAVEVGASESDRRRIDLLERNGYQQGPIDWHGMFRDLREPIEDAVVPEGFTVRALAEDEIAARVESVRAVWPGNRVTPDRYRELRGLPHYRPELDLVAVTPDGALGAFCTVWLDEVNGVGHFEPVGTRPEYRRRGLGRAVVREGLRRVRSLGAATACVFCHVDSHAALSLYESCGMMTRRRDCTYSRKL